MKGAYNDIFLRLMESIIAGIFVCILLPFYFALNSRELSVEETQQFMEDFFFKGEPLVYGESTRQQFLQAMEQIKSQSK